MCKFTAIFGAAIFVVQVAFGFGAAAQTVESCYKGKTVKIILGAPVGGSYGLYGQIVSRHMGKFVPGNPSFIIQAMPGGGGLVSLNYLGQVAPRDGSVVTIAHISIILDGLFNPKVRFAVEEFEWIGRLTGIAFVAVTSRASGIKSVGEARLREVIAGGPGISSVPGQFPYVLNKIAGTKFKTTSGYQGTGATFIALERNEIEMAANSVDSLRSFHWDKIQRGELVPIAIQAAQRLKELPRVPTLAEFASADLEKAYVGVISSAAELGRSVAAPPKVPMERVEALRNAFNSMISDREFRADVEKLQLSLEPLNGQMLDRLIKSATNLTPEMRDRLRRFQAEFFSK